ncbi:bifunctional aminoglycoside phosphotransferase/ATP-binding protein [Methylococcus mesophilus]|uniref:bifunctional aminoglycoside phosphotransferase/ATP-binding protein n=1 Tax=Methylococcus mesophilus TaxID=2993564 RepID=UPI00224A8C9D|nr:bifunctional aminoglycoside phosphotransferase/ATP-binding protein [Methylococcus mesophilus]UZR28350.1 AAA family ATPase [Methylococcus mesophilus]
MNEIAAQGAFPAGLMTAEAYPHPVSDIRLIETHISWVFLTGTYAYKVKKPVDFGFLDFSTLELRLRFCEEELRLNRRLAPEIYLAVCPIAGSPQTPRIEGEGSPFEYAVKMRQFAEGSLLADVAAAQALTADHIGALARLVAEFHCAIPQSGSEDDYGSLSSIRRATMDNFTHIEAILPPEHVARDIARLRESARRDHETLEGVFCARKREGYVRECHGDLHLANIALIDGKPVPFDAIEFNPELRWIDVISELAFVAMDLEARGLTRLAAKLVNGYLSITGDYGGMVLWDYYRRYRAMVRAKIAALTWEHTAQDAARDAHLAGFRSYVDYALSLLPDRPARLILMHGVSGSGKTHVAAQLAEETGAIMIRSDVERKRLASRCRADPAQVYLPAFTRTTYDRLLELAAPLLHAGLSVILDATFLERRYRDDARRVADTSGAGFAIIAMDAPEATLRERIRARQRAGADPSDADLDVLEQQLRSRIPLSEEEAGFTVNCGPDSTLPELLARLRDHRAQS